MADGFFFWYRQSWGQGDPASLFHSLEDSGIRLVNPATGRVTVISNGPDSWGDQIPVSPQQLVRATELEAEPEVNFQMWLDGGTDVFVRVRRLRGNAAAVEFGLDGLGASQESVVLAVAHAVRQTWKDCLGLVVDRFGGTEDTDWDAVVLHGEPDVGRMPDILAVRHDTAARNARLAGLDSRSVPPLLVYGDAAHLFA